MKPLRSASAYILLAIFCGCQSSRLTTADIKCAIKGDDVTVIQAKTSFDHSPLHRQAFLGGFKSGVKQGMEYRATGTYALVHFAESDIGRISSQGYGFGFNAGQRVEPGQETLHARMQVAEQPHRSDSNIQVAGVCRYGGGTPTAGVLIQMQEIVRAGPGAIPALVTRLEQKSGANGEFVFIIPRHGRWQMVVNHARGTSASSVPLPVPGAKDLHAQVELALENNATITVHWK